jgi:hypothetical protein
VHARHCPACYGDRGGCQGGASGEPGKAPVLFPVLAGGCRGQGSPQVLSPLGDLPGAGRSCQGVFGRQVGDQRGNFRRHRRRQRRQRLLLVRQCNRQGFPVEREPAGKALEGHDAQRIQVGRGHSGRTRDPFRRQVPWCSDQHSWAGEWRGSRRMGNPEVGDLHLPALADQQIPRLDVAVHQASRMCGLQGPGCLGDQAHRPGWVYRSLIQQPGQRRPVDQFHDQVGRIGLAVVIYLRDTRMRQRARMPGLGTEPGQVLPMFGISGPQQLHRHRPVQHEVCGTPNLAHPARGDTVVQPVSALKQQSGRYWDGIRYHHNGGHYPIRAN